MHLVWKSKRKKIYGVRMMQDSVIDDKMFIFKQTPP